MVSLLPSKCWCKRQMFFTTVAFRNVSQYCRINKSSICTFQGVLYPEGWLHMKGSLCSGFLVCLGSSFKRMLQVSIWLESRNITFAYPEKMHLKGSHINHRWEGAQLDGYMNGSKRIQSKKTEGESNAVCGHRFKAMLFVQCGLCICTSSSLVTAASRCHVHSFTLSQEGSRVQTRLVFKIFGIPA